jgi:catechol 2,3-dioxygenase-like lactoylglutathione lyase family enzyme
LPGHGEEGPTLEIFAYANTVEHEIGAPNRQGLGHLAFEVEDVAATVGTLLERGGSLVGAVTEKQIEGVGTIAFVYARDPEGNIIEIQSWRRAGGSPMG